MTDKKIRVLLAKPGLDGHDRGIKVIAAAFRDAGFEVIYTGLRQTPDQIVNAAVQEDVDVIGVSILSGAHMTLFPEIKKKMEEKGIGDTILFGGGIIPEDDIKKLESQGIAKLFTPGATTEETVNYVRTAMTERGDKKDEDKIM
ncbi:MAG: cobalamin B12-binding domain-containing protein [candidate division Zixibacteria bacterium]|nr:cobalamin B12-binding domain-containing protein [candidate division Zixibacteria bacterium]